MRIGKAYLIFAVSLLVACVQGGPVGQTQPTEVLPAVELPTQIPPTDTSTQVEPQPGVVLSGPIEIGDMAKKAVINLTVSEDGSSIASWSVAFEALECETLKTDTLITKEESLTLISQAAFEVTSSKIGELRGQFSAPSQASGTIHLLIDYGLGGEAIECGTWEWSAAESGESDLPVIAEPENPLSPSSPEAIPTLPASTDMQPVSPADLPVVNDTLVESENKVYVNGEVENHSPDNIQFIKITARLFDSSGSQAGEGFTFAYPRVCPPGERAAFSVMMDRPATYQRYELEVEAKTTSETPFTDLRVVGEISKPDPFGLGYPQICGLVENTGETTLEHANLVAVLYDAAGKVVSVTFAPPGSPDNLLIPGQLGTFSLIPYPFGTQYASYRWILEGTPTTKSPPPDLEIISIEKVGDNLAGVARYPGPGTASVYGITAIIFDAGGKIIDCLVGITRPQDLAAGDSAPFELLMLPPAFERYELYAFYTVK